MFLKRLKKIAAVALVTYVLIEMVCFIFITVKFKAAHFPTFKFEYHYRKYDFPIAEINPVWGTWHYQETYVEKKQCFESVYHINAFGARDRNRIKQGDTNRIIFLGDSFIEGYGLAEADRLTNQLEILTQKEVLNFGCGYFTPTQEYLLYENLAKDFSHQTIVLGILPFNDLVEDDTSFVEKDGFVHYQPYFQGTSPGYRLMYRVDQLAKSTFNKEGYFAIQNTASARIKRVLKEFTFWFNIYQFIQTNKPGITDNHDPYSAYYDCTNQQFDKLGFIIKKLKDAAPGKRIIVMGIPVYNDFIRSTVATPVFSKKMDSLCHEINIEYIDLLPAFKQRIAEPRQLYFSCDGHWNAAANRMAAEIILPLLQQ